MATERIPSRHLWKLGGSHKEILKDREELTSSYIDYMFARTSRMFEYKNLPDYIPIREIELILQFGGFIYFKKIKDKIYGFYGFKGGELNAYYEPTEIVITNPYLRLTSIDDINNKDNKSEDGVLIWNDSSHIGLYPLHERYASLVAHVDITMRVSLVNARIPFMMSGNDSDDIGSIKEFLADVENGILTGIKISEPNNIINDKTNINATPLGLQQRSTFTELIEARQYYLAQWYNELGIDANYNMKREAIGQGEIDSGTEVLKPLPDDMLACRREGFKKFNEFFGTNIEVDYGSIWESRKHIDTFLPPNKEEVVIDEDQKPIIKTKEETQKEEIQKEETEEKENED